MALSDDGQLLAGGTIDGDVTVWRLGDGAGSPATVVASWVAHPEQTFDDTDVVYPNPDLLEIANQIHFGGGTRALLFTPEGRLLSGGGLFVRSWNPATGDLTSEAVPLIVPFQRSVYRLEWATGSVLAHATFGGAVLDPVTLESRALALPNGRGEADTSVYPVGATLTPDGKVVAVNSDGALIRVEPETGTEELGFRDLRLAAVTDMAASADRAVIAVASADGVGLFSLDGSQLLAEALPLDGRLALNVSPDGRYVGASDLGLSPALLYDLESNGGPWAEPIQFPGSGTIESIGPWLSVHRFEEGGASVSDWLDPDTLEPSILRTDVGTGGAVSADDTLFAGGGFVAGPTIQVWDLDAGEVVSPMLDDLVPEGGWLSGTQSVSFNLDNSRLLATGPQRDYAEWDTESWKTVRHETGQDIVSAAFHPGGTEIVTVDSTGLLTARHAETFEPSRSFAVSAGVEDFTAGPYFSTDGRYLIAAQHGTPRLFHYATGQQIGASFPNDRNLVAGTSPHGVVIPLATGVGEHALVWNLDVDTWFDVACLAAGGNLTEAEWEQFGPTGEPHRATCPRWAGG